MSRGFQCMAFQMQRSLRSRTHIELACLHIPNPICRGSRFNIRIGYTCRRTTTHAPRVLTHFGIDTARGIHRTRLYIFEEEAHTFTNNMFTYRFDDPFFGGGCCSCCVVDDADDDDMARG